VVDERIADVMPVRADVVDVIDPPAYETLERMLGAIDRADSSGGAPAAPDDEDTG
jgi:hypothetical protein